MYWGKWIYLAVDVQQQMHPLLNKNFRTKSSNMVNLVVNIIIVVIYDSLVAVKSIIIP
jgi:hypothetical protein